MNNKKTKVLLSTLIITLGLSGCSFNLNKNDNKIIVKYDKEYFFENNNSVDKKIEFDKEKTSKLDYTYLIEKTDYTNRTLAHIIDEKNISSKSQLLDLKKEKDKSYFEESPIQSLTIQKAFILFDCESLKDIVGVYGECEINCKKLYTLDGEILYNFETVFTFNDFAEKYLFLNVKENDTIKSTILYRLNEDNTLTILYKNQTGVLEDSKNVLEKNFNNKKEILVPIEKTIFNELDGKYPEEYLLEELNEYNENDLRKIKENTRKN